MKKLALSVSAALLLVTGAADAHGPTRQKVTESIVINAPADAVWNKIKDFHDASWMPMVAKTIGEGGNAVGAHRELTLKSGATVKEELKSYDEASKSFAYKIPKDGVDKAVLPVNDYSAKISVTAEGSGSKVEFNGAFYRGYMNNCPCPEDQTEEAAHNAVTKIYQESLAGLKAAVEKK